MKILHPVRGSISRRCAKKIVVFVSVSQTHAGVILLSRTCRIVTEIDVDVVQGSGSPEFT